MVRFGSKVIYVADPVDIWGNIHTIGNAELAARLGSINIYDRRGDTIWMDDFEAPTLKWSTETSGAGASVDLSIAHSSTRSQSCMLKAGSTSYRRCTIEKYFGVKIAGKLGCELSFTLDEHTLTFQLFFTYYDGSHLWQGMLGYDALNNRVTFMDSEGIGHHWLVDVNLVKNDNTWHTMKLVIDTETKKYVRCLLDNNSLVPTGFEDLYPDEAADIDPGIAMKVIHISDTSGISAKSYIDNVIITQNEP